MRLISRTADADLARDLLPLAAGIAAVGASFGAVAIAADLPPWVPIAMSVFVFAGGAQFFAVGVIATGGGALAAVLGGLLLNARHLPYGLAIGGLMGRGWPARLLGSHLLVDESTAFALAQSDQTRARRAFWATGAMIFVVWNIAVVVGVLAGQAIGDPGTFGMDAMFPAALLALVLPSLRDRAASRAAALGAVVAVATTPFLPGGVPVLLALVGLLAAGPQGRLPTSEARA